MPYLFIFLSVADAVVTVIGIREGRDELNPLLHSLMQQIGVLPALVLVKSVTIAVVLALAKQVAFLLPVGCFVMAGAVLWNVGRLAS